MTKMIRVLIVLIVITVILLAINLALDGYDKYLRRTHPIEYSEIVENFSREYNIDKFLIYAIIKTESGFDPDAVSNVGARGLMQIMPDTFEWIRDYKLYEDLEFDSMFNSDDNIRYGVYLIAYHMDSYQNVDNSLAAYHAGNAAVDGWLGDSRYSADGRTLDEIPISDTAHYVSKVNKAYETYIKLYY